MNWLDNCGCQCFGDVALQRSMLQCQKILAFLRGFAANTTAHVTSFYTVGVSSGEGIFQGGNLFDENVRGNCWGGKYPGEKRPGRNDWIPCKITSLYVQRLWFVISWLAYWHTDTQSGRLTDRQIDSFWPVMVTRICSTGKLRTGNWWAVPIPSHTALSS